MPRRTARRRRQQQPPPNYGQNINIQLPPKPTGKALKGALEAVVSASLEIRVQALMSVVGWYDEMSHYLIEKSRQDVDLAKKLNGDLLEVFVKANKLRNLGVNEGAQMPERETALRRAIEQFEKYCEGYVPFKLADYWQKYQDKKDALEAVEKRVQEKYQYLIQTLSKAFPGMKFVVSPEISGQRYDGNGAMMYGKDRAKDLLLLLKREGLLKLVLGEVTEIAKIQAVAPNGQGGFFVDPKKWVENINLMLKSFVQFCQTSDSVPKLVKRPQIDAPVKPVGVPSTKTVQAPRAPRQRVAGAPKVAGRYEAGSAVAVIWEALSDEKEHSKRTLLSPFSHLNNPEGRLGRLIREGKMFGEWKIDVDGDKVKMTILKQAGA